MRKAVAGPPITRGVIETAIRSYVAKGGKITMLPPQSVTTRTVIGGDMWAAYESADSCLFIS
ncbi:MAG: hypothetical protein HQM14_05795 [SAR324 cluster bacterium]|nr:hypothetical protein [SAR324 cluster bacterium]